MNSVESTLDWVRAQFTQLLGLEPGTITVESRLIDDLGADSIDVVEVVTAAESHFDISIEEEQIYGLETVGAVAELIDRLRGERGNDKGQ